MYKLDEIRKIIQNELPFLKEQFGVTRIRIFGSYARGEATENSDIDLLVDLEEERSLMDLGGVQYHLQQTLGIKVDVGEYDYLHPIVKNSIGHDIVSI